METIKVFTSPKVAYVPWAIRPAVEEFILDKMQEDLDEIELEGLISQLPCLYQKGDMVYVYAEVIDKGFVSGKGYIIKSVIPKQGEIPQIVDSTCIEMRR